MIRNLKLFILAFFSILFFYSYSDENKNLSNEFFNNKSDNSSFSYIYAPGMMGTEVLMGRYCPSFIASTGEKITWKKGGHVIGEPHSAVIFAEINLKKPYGFSINPITVAINKLRKNLFPFCKRFFEQKFEFSVEDNPKSDKSVANYSFDFLQANIGQKKDIKCLYKTYKDHIKKFPKTKIVLYGDSRGAATIFNFIAQYNPNNVGAAILDGIYDDVPHCIKHFIFDDKDSNAESSLHDIISFVMHSYKKKGPFPIQYADKISDNVPLLLVTSLKDGLTAPQCAFNLYIKLKKRDYKNVHLLVLNNSLHPCYMIDDENDKEKYESVVHAFYKYYKLPYNTEKALKGQKAFEETQPSISDLKKYNLPKCWLCLNE